MLSCHTCHVRQMHFTTDILIIGGGLSGLTAALHLQQSGLDVLLIEKEAYPHHKVCGEYISNEVLPYFNWLGIDVGPLQPASLHKLHFSALSGKSILTGLPLGGFGLSRFTLDQFLAQQFLSRGGKILHDTVLQVTHNTEFCAGTGKGDTISAKLVIGAYGKRSALDRKLNRSFLRKKSPVLAVKGHYTGEFEEGLVGLHNFRGGYCGISKIEGGKINVCYLADYYSFKKYKDLEAFQHRVLEENKHLKAAFSAIHPLFSSPLTVSQLAFGPKEIAPDHLLMIGDAAGLIHPLCGNGMAMAIHGARICSELVLLFFSGQLSAAELENQYSLAWRKTFSGRLRMGSVLSRVLEREKLTEGLLAALLFVPALLPLIIRRTHGK